MVKVEGRDEEVLKHIKEGGEEEERTRARVSM